MNLLKETIDILEENGKSLDDVLWFGCVDFEIEQDIKQTFDVEYHQGYGSAEIATDLIVVGDGFFLERREYDGSEWWEFKKMISRPSVKRTNVTVCNGDMWASLEEMNRPGGKYGEDGE